MAFIEKFSLKSIYNVEIWLNHLPNEEILNRCKFKEFVDDKINAPEK